MSPTHKYAVAATFVVVLTGLGAGDAWLTKPDMRMPVVAETSPPPEATPPTPSMASSSSTSSFTGPTIIAQTNSSSSSSSQSSAPQGVAKRDGIDIFAILTAQGIETEATGQVSLIRRVIPEEVDVPTRILLKNDDRVAFFSWVQSSDAKAYFLALKEALHSSFSSNVTDLSDSVDMRDGKPPRSILTFRDPGINEERLLFVRIQDRLYEFHIADDKDADVRALMDALTD